MIAPFNQSVANALTLFRLIIPPFFLWIYADFATTEPSAQTAALALLLLLLAAELSDVLDGYYARASGKITDFGRIFDPTVDSIYRNSILFIITLPPISIPIKLPLIFLYRDLIVNGLRTLCALKGIALSARTSGKIKAIVQATASIVVVALLLPYGSGTLSLQDLQSMSQGIIALSGCYTVLSGLEYLYAHRHINTIQDASSKGV